MAKSDITLPDGTNITIEGSPEEIAKVISLYGGSARQDASRDTKKQTSVRTPKNSSNQDKKDMVLEVVNSIKNADDIEEIEKRILEKSSQVDRVLLPLYIIMRDFDNGFSLSSNDIYRILKELGINMALPNIIKTLKGSALKYVVADKATKKNQSTPFKISIRGKKYIEELLSD